MTAATPSAAHGGLPLRLQGGGIKARPDAGLADAQGTWRQNPTLAITIIVHKQKKKISNTLFENCIVW